MNARMPRLTFWRVVFVALMIAGAYATWIRFAHGLGASTNLSDEFPWGLWVGFDVLCGVMLAAGGFTLMATVHIFHAEKFRPIVRPALLTAYLGYLLVVVALMFDLGRPYRVWHPLVMWNPRSVMFEVGWCVTLYTTVLTLEFLPLIFEKLRLEKPLRILHAIATPIVIAGVILSTLHQSSLGSLYLIMAGKLHPLWYSPLLPVFFFVSAIAIGLAMTIFESSMSERHFGHSLSNAILFPLARIMAVVLALYAVLRVQDLSNRGAWGYVVDGSRESWFFIAEAVLGLVLPLALLALPRMRESRRALFGISTMVVFGFVINRLNVAITGMEGAAGQIYVPKWTEVVITMSIVAAGIAVFYLAVKHLPIFHEGAVHGRREEVPAAVPAPSVPVHP